MNNLENVIFKELTNLHQIIYKLAIENLGFAKNNYAVFTLSENELIMRKIDSILSNMGFRRIDSPFRMGKRALVFKTTCNQVLRISAREMTTKRVELDEILQPLISINTSENIQIEVLAEVDTENVTTSHVNSLITSLAKKGYLFWDSSIQNIGVLNDGTPIIIDGDAVVHESILHSECLDGESLSTAKRWDHMTFLESFVILRRTPHPSMIDLTALEDSRENLEAEYTFFKKLPSPQYDFAKSQMIHNKNLGLKPETIRGVYPSNQLSVRNIYSNPNIDKLIKIAIIEHKLYPHELANIIAQAAAEITEESLSGVQYTGITKRIEYLIKYPEKRQKDLVLSDSVIELLSNMPQIKKRNNVQHI